jgi:hypothetical protein
MMMSFSSVVIVSFMRKKRIRHIRVVELAFLPIKNHDTMIPTYVDSIEEKTKRQKITR